jgi:DNA-binding IclR family transcriptional regulator
MEFNQHERALLNLLADEWEKSGPPGYMETSIIAERLGMPVADVKSTVRSLFVNGLVDTDEVDTFAAYLTPAGYEQAKEK